MARRRWAYRHGGGSIQRAVRSINGRRRLWQEGYRILKLCNRRTSSHTEPALASKNTAPTLACTGGFFSPPQVIAQCCNLFIPHFSQRLRLLEARARPLTLLMHCLSRVRTSLSPSTALFNLRLSVIHSGTSTEARLKGHQVR